MAILVQCPACRKRFKAPPKFAGKRVRCKCGSPIAVPAGQAVELDLSDVIGLSHGVSARSSACPECSAALPLDAVLCTACGFNLKTGLHMAASAAGDRPSAPRKAPCPTKKADRDDGYPSIVSRLLKPILFLIFLSVVAGGVWLVRGALHNDPAAEARLKKDKVFPGMTIAQTVNALERAPREVWIEEVDPNDKGPFKLPKRVRLPYVDDFMNSQPKERLEDGFMFLYRFSERDHLCIFFMGNGKVDRAELVNPMAALGM